MSDFAAVKKGEDRLKPVVSSDAGISGKDSMGRRIWDKEYFSKKFESSDGQEPATKMAKLITGEAAESLKQRDQSLNLDSVINDKKILSITASKSEQGGFFCEICDAHFHDSDAYLAHINGKLHNRMLGMNMQVESVTVDRVREKLKALKMAIPKSLSYRQRLKLQQQQQEQQQQQHQQQEEQQHQQQHQQHQQQQQPEYAVMETDEQ